MILLFKNSLVVGYAIFPLAGVAVTYCHDLSKESSLDDFDTSQMTLRGDTLHHTLDQLVCPLNRALVMWILWTSSDNEAVWVLLFHEVNNQVWDKLLPIICIKKMLQ
jgi:hypothetical protein